MKTTWIFRPAKLRPEKYVETTWIFWSAKLHWKSTWEQRGFFDQQNYTDKSTWEQRGLFNQRNYIEKSTRKQRGFFDQRNYVKESTWKGPGFFDQRNYVLKSTWKRRRNLSKFALRHIDVMSTSNRCGFDVACSLGSEIANGLKVLAETSQKNNKMTIEEERKREERCPLFWREEVEKNEQHKLLIAQIFANASQPQFTYCSQPGHQGNSSTSSTSDLYQPVQDDTKRDPSFYPSWFDGLCNSLNLCSLTGCHSH